MSGSELCEIARLIPPVTILTERVREDLHRPSIQVTKLSWQFSEMVAYLDPSYKGQEITHHYYPLQGQGCAPITCSPEHTSF